jgi:hypothetical protein
MAPVYDTRGSEARIMRRIPIIGLSVAILTLALATSARSQVVQDGLSPIEQTVMADIVVVGKVTGMEPQTVLAERWRGDDKVGHLVATIRIEESLLGAKGLTHIRVGFAPDVREDRVNNAQKIYL